MTATLAAVDGLQQQTASHSCLISCSSFQHRQKQLGKSWCNNSRCGLHRRLVHFLLMFLIHTRDVWGMLLHRQGRQHKHVLHVLLVIHVSVTGVLQLCCQEQVRRLN